MWPDLGQPTPKNPTEPHRLIVWPKGERIAFDGERHEGAESWATFLKSRRTARAFRALEVRNLGDWLDMSCRVQQIQRSDLGFDLSRRPAPSAGAIHPIHVVLSTPGQPGWHRYDAKEHTLVAFESSLAAHEVHKAMQGVLTAPDATLVLLAAEPGMTGAKYDHPASLIWRDAGALLAVMGLAAQALSLAFCPLGVTGEPWVGRLLEERGLVGVGAAFVGKTVPAT